MKILHLSNNTIPGGAGKAARTLNEALQRAGMQSDRLDVSTNTKWDKFRVLFRSYFDKIPLLFYNRNPKTAFSTANIGIGMNRYKIVREADIIHLHWVHQGYMGFKDMKYLASLKKKVFINMHDSWWLSGGCHVTHGCDLWKSGCGNCPQLNSKNANDLSRRIFLKKREILEEMNPTIICVSRWMFDRASIAPMFRGFKIIQIPNCIDLEKYQSFDKKTAREKLNLPINKKLILFGAVVIGDPNKGFTYFREAVNAIENEDFEVVIFGNNNSADFGLKKKVNYLGLLKDDYTLALTYSAADVFVAPSLEDNFPCTVLESLACGTPVVAFNIGGMPDMITHERNGYLAEKMNATKLNKGMVFCISKGGEMSDSARNKAVEEFSYAAIAKLYAILY